MEFDERFEKCDYNESVEVSQYGRICKARKNKEKDKVIILKQTLFGKYYVIEDPNNKEKIERVHRLVALTWKKDEYKKGEDLVVHHIDYNPANNRADNLKWLPREEHMKVHGIDTSFTEEEISLSELKKAFYESEEWRNEVELLEKMGQ
jgi:hypothetical protein